MPEFTYKLDDHERCPGCGKDLRGPSTVKFYDEELCVSMDGTVLETMQGDDPVIYDDLSTEIVCAKCGKELPFTAQRE